MHYSTIGGGGGGDCTSSFTEIIRKIKVFLLGFIFALYSTNQLDFFQVYRYFNSLGLLLFKQSARDIFLYLLSLGVRRLEAVRVKAELDKRIASISQSTGIVVVHRVKRKDSLLI